MTCEPLSPAERFGSLDADGVAALDAAAVAAGVAMIQLMEVAGLAVARTAWRMLGEQPARVLVVAGRGNNGGDGLVAARHLRAWGCPVSVLVAGEEAGLRGVLPAQVRAARGAGVEVVATVDAAVVAGAVDAAELVVDALLGTGLRDAPREPDATAIRALASHQSVLAVDVPSGLDATTGEVHDPCVTARVTCTLTACKAGLWHTSARAHAGEIVVADIGMPVTAWESVGLRPPSEVRGGVLVTVPAALIGGHRIGVLP